MMGYQSTYDRDPPKSNVDAINSVLGKNICPKLSTQVSVIVN